MEDTAARIHSLQTQQRRSVFMVNQILEQTEEALDRRLPGERLDGTIPMRTTDSDQPLTNSVVNTLREMLGLGIDTHGMNVERRGEEVARVLLQGEPQFNDLITSFDVESYDSDAKQTLDRATVYLRATVCNLYNTTRQMMMKVSNALQQSVSGSSPDHAPALPNATAVFTVHEHITHVQNTYHLILKELRSILSLTYAVEDAGLRLVSNADEIENIVANSKSVDMEYRNRVALLEEELAIIRGAFHKGDASSLLRVHAMLRDYTYDEVAQHPELHTVASGLGLTKDVWELIQQEERVNAERASALALVEEQAPSPFGGGLGGSDGFSPKGARRASIMRTAGSRTPGENSGATTPRSCSEMGSFAKRRERFIVFIQLEDLSYMFDRSHEAVQSAVQLFRSVVETTAQQYKLERINYNAKDDTSAIPSAGFVPFRSGLVLIGADVAPVCAFAMEVQRRLLVADWPKKIAMAKHYQRITTTAKSGREVVLWCGPRVRIAVHYGAPIVVPGSAGDSGLRYRGAVIEVASRTLSGARAGETLLTSDAYKIYKDATRRAEIPADRKYESLRSAVVLEKEATSGITSGGNRRRGSVTTVSGPPEMLHAMYPDGLEEREISDTTDVQFGSVAFHHKQDSHIAVLAMKTSNSGGDTPEASSPTPSSITPFAGPPPQTQQAAVSGTGEAVHPHQEVLEGSMESSILSASSHNQPSSLNPMAPLHQQQQRQRVEYVATSNVVMLPRGLGLERTDPKLIDLEKKLNQAEILNRRMQQSYDIRIDALQRRLASTNESIRKVSAKYENALHTIFDHDAGGGDHVVAFLGIDVPTESISDTTPMSTPKPGKQPPTTRRKSVVRTPKGGTTRSTSRPSTTKVDKAPSLVLSSTGAQHPVDMVPIPTLRDMEAMSQSLAHTMSDVPYYATTVNSAQSPATASAPQQFLSPRLAFVAGDSVLGTTNSMVLFDVADVSGPQDKGGAGPLNVVTVTSNMHTARGSPRRISLEHARARRTSLDSVESSEQTVDEALVNAHTHVAALNSALRALYLDPNRSTEEAFMLFFSVRGVAPAPKEPKSELDILVRRATGDVSNGLPNSAVVDSVLGLCAQCYLSAVELWELRHTTRGARQSITGTHLLSPTSSRDAKPRPHTTTKPVSQSGLAMDERMKLLKEKWAARKQKHSPGRGGNDSSSNSPPTTVFPAMEGDPLVKLTVDVDATSNFGAPTSVTPPPPSSVHLLGQQQLDPLAASANVGSVSRGGVSPRGAPSTPGARRATLTPTVSPRNDLIGIGGPKLRQRNMSLQPLSNLTVALGEHQQQPVSSLPLSTTASSSSSSGLYRRGGPKSPGASSSLPRLIPPK
eukprot:PhM_4_TR18777/c0_g1_i4/m.58822